jgi:hypothetical protein
MKSNTRFPADFMFELTEFDFDNMVAQFVIPSMFKNNTLRIAA